MSAYIIPPTSGRHPLPAIPTPTGHLPRLSHLDFLSHQSLPGAVSVVSDLLGCRVRVGPDDSSDTQPLLNSGGTDWEEGF